MPNNIMSSTSQIIRGRNTFHHIVGGSVTSQHLFCGGAMRSALRHSLLSGVVALAGAAFGCSAAVGDDGTDETVDALTTNVSFPDAFGTVKVISTDAAKGIDFNNPFFKNLGTNGRTCNSCHKLENSLGISVRSIQAIFTKTDGRDPIFRI